MWFLVSTFWSRRRKSQHLISYLRLLFGTTLYANCTYAVSCSQLFGSTNRCIKTVFYCFKINYIPSLRDGVGVPTLIQHEAEQIRYKNGSARFLNFARLLYLFSPALNASINGTISYLNCSSLLLDYVGSVFVYTNVFI